MHCETAAFEPMVCKSSHLSPEERALVELGAYLLDVGYRFVTPTPATHALVNERADNELARSLAGALGWSRPFAPDTLPRTVEECLHRAGALERRGNLFRSRVRFSTVAADRVAKPHIFVHSAFPTHQADSVFFGPDTYRFIQFLRTSLKPCQRLVDVGAGAGAGGLLSRDRAAAVVLSDINPLALRMAAINTALCGATNVELVASDVMANVGGVIDCVVANPPYLVDAKKRAYRDGGGALGLNLSIRIVAEAMVRLEAGGQLLLYTGSPVVRGTHPLRERLAGILASRPCHYEWQELDPDVFGEELGGPAYQSVERIAVVGLRVEVS
jgi:methylase of polypeptide subunit release factors